MRTHENDAYQVVFFEHPLYSPLFKKHRREFVWDCEYYCCQGERFAESHNRQKNDTDGKEHST